MISEHFRLHLGYPGYDTSPNRETKPSKTTSAEMFFAALKLTLYLVGFTSLGPAAGSLAALIQSYIGNVAAGSLFALAQAFAMAA